MGPVAERNLVELGGGELLFSSFDAAENATVYAAGASEVNDVPAFVRIQNLPAQQVYRRVYCHVEAIVESGEDWNTKVLLTLKRSGRPVATIPLEIGQNTASGTAWARSLSSLVTSTIQPAQDSLRVSLSYRAGFQTKYVFLNPLKIQSVCDEAIIDVSGTDARVQKVRAVRVWLGILSSNAP